MPVKKKYTHKRPIHKRPIHKRRTHKRRIYKRPSRRVISGGNYEKDFTSRMIDGSPTKSANKIVVTVPGYGTMSGSAYIRLKEDLDRNGKQFYD